MIGTTNILGGENLNSLQLVQKLGHIFYLRHWGIEFHLCDSRFVSKFLVENLTPLYVKDCRAVTLGPTSPDFEGSSGLAWHIYTQTTHI